MLGWIAVAMGAGGQAVLDGSITDHLVEDVDGDGRIEGVTVSASVEDGFEVRVGRHGCVPGGYLPGAAPRVEPHLRVIGADEAGVTLLEVQAEDDGGTRTYLLHVDPPGDHAAEEPCARIHPAYEWHRLVEEGRVVQDLVVTFDARDRTVTSTVHSQSGGGSTTVEVALWDGRLRAYVPIETWEVGVTPARERICHSW